MSAPLKLHPAVGVNVYKQLPKELSDTLRHSSNNSSYPEELHRALDKQHTHRTQDNPESASNITPLF